MTHDDGVWCAHCEEEIVEGEDTLEDSGKTYHEDCFHEAQEGWDYEDEEFLIDGVGFADPGGRSALRAATKDNPRNLPCPECGAPNRLTPLDRERGYRCDSCADRAEMGW